MAGKLVLDLWVDDESCKECIKELDDILGPDGELNDIPDGQVLVVAPDYNTAGRMTHHHVYLLDVSWIHKPEARNLKGHLKGAD